MIRPSPLTLLLMFACLPLATLAIWHPMLWWVWALALSALLFAAGVDLILAPAARDLRLAAEHSGTIYLGEEDSLDVALASGPLLYPVRAQVLCQFTGDMEQMEPLETKVWATGQGEVKVPLEPLRRGKVFLDEVYVRWSGPLGLFRRVKRFEVAKEFSVVPNILAVRRAAAQYSSRHSSGYGAKSTKRRGQGSEFEALREFVPGMSLKQVNWRASAKHRQLLCRENRFERNHQVILAIDTGRLMSERLDGIPRLDQAINAALLLGYVGLKTGDRIGLCGFDENLHTFQRPVRGAAAFNKLVHVSSGLDYGAAETNFTLSMARLADHLKRRSILVIMTDFVDSIAAELMVENLRWLAKRHLILLVALRDREVETFSNLEPKSITHINRAVVAKELIDQRDVVIKQLRNQGIFCIDTHPGALSEKMIDRYLEIYRRELV